MIRCRRRYDIVPFVESVVEDDLFFESVGEGVKYFSSGPVHFVDNLGKYLQTLFRHSVGSPAAGVCHRVEWCPAPGACYLGEEPVLDGVGAAHPCFLSAMPAGAPPILPQKQASRSYLILPTRFMKRSAL